MKANETPEKIWMNDDWFNQFDDKDFMEEDSVEYTRTDAFIKKAGGFSATEKVRTMKMSLRNAWNG